MGLWCINGCQDLAGLGECARCGYVGPGVPEGETDYVLEANEETGRYEFVLREHWEEDMEADIECRIQQAEDDAEAEHTRFFPAYEPPTPYDQRWYVLADWLRPVPF